MPLSCSTTISFNRVDFILRKYSLRQDQQQRKDDETTNDDTNDTIFHFYTLYAISIDISDDDDAILEMKNWPEHDINSDLHAIAQSLEQSHYARFYYPQFWHCYRQMDSKTRRSRQID